MNYSDFNKDERNISGIILGVSDKAYYVKFLSREEINSIILKAVF